MDKLSAIGKTVTVMATAYGVAVAGAQLLLYTRGSNSPVLFALYLCGQSWVEGVFFITLAAILLICKRHFGSLEGAARAIGSGFRIERRSMLSAKPLYALLLLSLSLVFVEQSVLVFRYRQFFWSQVAKKKYIEHYAQIIDDFTRVGRVNDAYNLLDYVMSTSGGTSESGRLQSRFLALRVLRARSAQLFASASVGSWNPISQRFSFFKLAEAVRLNPQNYEAADKLRVERDLLEHKFLQADLQAICGSAGHVENAKYFATALVEAKLRWIDDGGKRECVHDFQKMRDSWELDSVNCILAVSEFAKRPYDSENLSKDVPACIQDDQIREESVSIYEIESKRMTANEDRKVDRDEEPALVKVWQTLVTRPWARLFESDS